LQCGRAYALIEKQRQSTRATRAKTSDWLTWSINPWDCWVKLGGGLGVFIVTAESKVRECQVSSAAMAFNSYQDAVPFGVKEILVIVST